jgi:hypothetical protein
MEQGPESRILARSLSGAIDIRPLRLARACTRPGTGNQRGGKSMATRFRDAWAGSLRHATRAGVWRLDSRQRGAMIANDRYVAARIVAGLTPRNMLCQ